jgi:hypothetical protein
LLLDFGIKIFCLALGLDLSVKVKNFGKMAKKTSFELAFVVTALSFWPFDGSNNGNNGVF